IDEVAVDREFGRAGNKAEVHELGPRETRLVGLDVVRPHAGERGAVRFDHGYVGAPDAAPITGEQLRAVVVAECSPDAEAVLSQTMRVLMGRDGRPRVR